ncbi:MAG: transcription elongation factor Spt5 [Thermoprotei archaeon]
MPNEHKQEDNKSQTTQETKPTSPTRLFAIKVSTGQELGTAFTADLRYSKSQDLQSSSIVSVLVLKEIRSYIFVEASNSFDAGRMFYGLRHVKAGAPTLIPYQEIETLLQTKIAASSIEPNYIVEIIAGPFKGMKAKVVGVDKAKNEVTVTLIEKDVSFAFPLTMSAESVKIISKGK